MIAWFWKLLASQEVDADSLIVGALVALLGLLAFTGYATWMDSHTFSPAQYGLAVASILGALGGARRLRDGISQPEEHHE